MDRSNGSSPSASASQHSAIIRLAAIALTLLIAGCDQSDPEQAALCRSLIFAFEDDAATAADIVVTDDAGRPARLEVEYRIGSAERWIACTFAASGMERDRLVLTSVETAADGQLDGTDLHMLRIWLGLRPLTIGARSDIDDGGVGRAVAYAAQQMINALSSGAIYALLAVGFTMVYAVLGKMFMAFGQIMMAGAYGAIIAGAATAMITPMASAALLAALTGAILVAAAYSLASGRLLRGVMRAPGNQAALIASIGLAVALQEYVRLTQGARETWLQPPFPLRVPLFEAGGFDVSIGASTLVVAGLAIMFFMLIAGALRTRFGRAYRACTDDIGMAALVGVRVPAVMTFVMLIGGVGAGCAGAITALLYGGVSFYTGALLGLKALTAAIVGGIGSIGGAALGGLLIAIAETTSVAYVNPAAKDIVVFAILVGVLIWRPHGLAGRVGGRGD